MSAFNLRRLLKPDVLKTIDPERLCELLRRFENDLNARQLGIPAPGSGEQLDYDALIEILHQPDVTALHDLCEALYFIDEMAVPSTTEWMLDEAKRKWPDSDWSRKNTPADLATQLWLADRHLLEKRHAERAIYRRRNFRVFGVGKTKLRNTEPPVELDEQRLVEELSPLFTKRNRSLVTKIFQTHANRTHWYMIRYGAMNVRAGCVKRGQSTSIFFRPEEYDIVGFCPERHELRINSQFNDPGAMYGPVFGELLYGDAAAFDYKIVYSLEPLRVTGHGALIAPLDSEIERIQLAEVRFMIGGKYRRSNIIRATDVLAAMKESHQSMPLRAPIAEAKFSVWFKGHKNERSVRLKTPVTTTYSRDEDSEAVEEWLTARGFKRCKGGPLDESTMWSVLPDCLDLEAAEIEWKWRLGAHLDWCRQFLVPCDQKATGYADEHGRQWQAHERDDHKWIAISDSGENQIEIQAADLNLLRFDSSTFAVSIINALNLRARTEQSFIGKKVYELGAYHPYEGIHVPVWLVCEDDRDTVRDAVNAINSVSSDRSIVLVPTRDLVDHTTDTLLEAAGKHWIALEEAFTIERDAALRQTEAMTRLLEKIKCDAVKSPDPEAGVAFFPTPSGAKWSDVSITFIDEQTVRVSVLGEEGSFTYSNMGMSDDRGAKPNAQWEMLWALACMPAAGDDRPKKPLSDVRMKKSRLASALEEFFRIDGNPFERGGTLPKPKFTLNVADGARIQIVNL